MTKKIIIAVNIVLAIIVILLIINKLFIIIKKQEQDLRICELQKEAIRDAYFDKCYFGEEG